MIVGASIAGCACAIALRRLGKTVHVKEKASIETVIYEQGETIGPEGILILKSLGIDIEQDFQALKKYSRFSAWGHNEILEKSYMRSVPSFSLLISKRSLIDAMRKAAARMGADINFNTKFEYHQGDLCDYSFIVDASGRARTIARKETRVNHYDRLTASCLKLHTARRNTIFDAGFIESYEHGWLYHTTDHENNAVVVCYTDRAIDGHPNLVNKHDLIQEIQKHSKAPISYQFGKADVHSHHIMAASSTNLDVSYGNNWMAIGDAKRTVDPISSQGITNALSDGLDGASIIRDILSPEVFNDPHKINIDKLNKEEDSKFNEFMKLRDRYYSMEGRWTEADFWSIRRP